MPSLQFGSYNISVWLFAPLLYIALVAVGWTIKKILFSFISRLTSRTQTRFDDVLLEALNAPVMIMILVWSAAAVTQVVLVKYSNTEFTRYILLTSKALTVLAIVLFVDRFSVGLLNIYSTRIKLLMVTQGFAAPVIHSVIVGLGVLVFLDSVGISVTPIIASLGIGSLAVALALQPTLENIFAGFQILLDHPIQTGHYVKLESGEEGYVDRIGWRSTWIRQLSNNMTIVPNKVVVNSRLTNFYEPSPRLAVLVEVGVHYNSDLKKVEQATIEVAEEIMKKVPGGIPDFKPFIRFHTLAASSINFTVIMQGKEFVDNFLIKHEFIKALAQRYQREQITIPFPITALNLSQEKVEQPFSPAK